MRALAGPAMLLVIVGGYLAARYTSRDDSPSRDFTELEFADSCYSLSSVLIANRLMSNASRTWTAPRKDAWTLKLDDIVQGNAGPARLFQRFTFEKYGDQVRLVAMEASEGMDADLAHNIDALLELPNERHSTPVDRCLAPGATGYHFVPKRYT
jgi:hypothetical protein